MTTNFGPTHMASGVSLRLATATPPRRTVSAAVIECARRAYALNGRRSALMGLGLFGDPAWDILLDLFLSECDDRSLCVTSVCIGSRSSPATALRYIAMLRARSLVERIPDAVDKRRTFIKLTDRGWNAMMDLLDGEMAVQQVLSGGGHRAAS